MKIIVGFLYQESIDICELVKLHDNYIWHFLGHKEDRKNVMCTIELSTRPVQKDSDHLGEGQWMWSQNVGYYLPFLDGDLDFLRDKYENSRSIL